MSSRVLVVDDDLQAAKPVISMLASRGYDVRTASDADSAMSSVRLWCPALVIADLKMPLVDGIDLCRRVREIVARPDHRRVRQQRRTDRKSAALDSGADDYLAKPFSAEKLLARVRVALSAKRGDAGGIGARRR